LALPCFPYLGSSGLGLGLTLEKKVGRGGLMVGGCFFCPLGLAERGGKPLFH